MTPGLFLDLRGPRPARGSPGSTNPARVENQPAAIGPGGPAERGRRGRGQSMITTGSNLGNAGCRPRDSAGPSRPRRCGAFPPDRTAVAPVPGQHCVRCDQGGEIGCAPGRSARPHERRATARRTWGSEIAKKGRSITSVPRNPVAIPSHPGKSAGESQAAEPVSDPVPPGRRRAAALGLWVRPQRRASQSASERRSPWWWSRS